MKSKNHVLLLFRATFLNQKRTALNFISCATTIDSVSYTHLDVYKRQVHRHLRAALVGRGYLLRVVGVRVVAVRAALLRVELDKMCIRDRPNLSKVSDYFLFFG